MAVTVATAVDFSYLSDEEILPIAQAGSQVAEEYLLRKYHHIVKAKAKPYFITGGDHEDIVQEGMIGLHKAVRDFRLGKGIPFRAFAELCITRQIITAIKSATRQKHTPLNYYVSLNRPVYNNEDSERTLLDVIANERICDPEQLVLGREELKLVHGKLIEVLSEFEYRVFMLYIQRASYKEIALLLRTTTKAVDNALCRIKRKIDERIKEEIN